MRKLKFFGKSIKTGRTAAHELYRLLCEEKYDKYPYDRQDLDDDMCVINHVIGAYWKPRYLIDKKNKTAIEFMNSWAKLQTVCADDIDWKSLEELPHNVTDKARDLNAVYPTFIREYNDGVAEVSWQINPDGYYYMDEDGYGMTDDEEVTIYSYVDRAGKPLVKFRYIKNADELDKMEKEARMNLAARK